MARRHADRAHPAEPQHRLSALVYVAPVALVLEALITGLIVSVGPEPELPADSDGVFRGQLSATLLEPRDRMVLAGWWLSVPILLALVLLLPRTRRSAVVRTCGVVVLVGSIILAVASALWFETPDLGFGPWTPRLHGWQLLVGVVATVVVLATMLAHAGRVRVVVSTVTVLVTAAFLLPALVQTPTSVVEPGHAAYTLDELVAPAAGHVPLVDYFPQYANLLGLPLALVLRSWPDHALAITLGWVFLLQAVTILGSVMVGAMVGGRRVVPLVFLLVAAPLVFATAGGVYPTAYLAAVPFRTALPVVTIATALAVFGRRVQLSRRRIGGGAAIVGGLAGVAGLNNPDHGLPVVLAVGGVVLLALGGWRDRLLAAVVGGCAVVLPFVLYTTGTALVGEAAEWSGYLLFPRMFGTIGFGNLAMSPFGTHVGVVSFFAAATVVGVMLLVRHRDSEVWRAQGFALAASGAWSMLTLPYYTGRSLPAQLLFGYAVQVGLVSAALVPLVLRGIATARSGRVRLLGAGATSVALALLAMGSIAGSLLAAPTPAASLERIRTERGGPWYADTLAIEAALRDPTHVELRRLHERGLLGQVMASSSLLELVTGMPSLAVSNHPDYLRIAVEMLRLQCREIATRSFAAVIVPITVTYELAGVPECRRALVVRDFYEQLDEWTVLVEVRRPAG